MNQSHLICLRCTEPTSDVAYQETKALS